MATGSSGPPGRWEPTRRVPPCLIGPAAAAGPSLVSLPPDDDPPSSLPQAAMIALMNGMLSPITVPRFTKSRRVIRPWAYDSMWSISTGDELRRSRSKMLMFIALPLFPVASRWDVLSALLSDCTLGPIPRP